MFLRTIRCGRFSCAFVAFLFCKTHEREIEYCALIVCADIRKSVFQAITDVLPRFGIQC